MVDDWWYKVLDNEKLVAKNDAEIEAIRLSLPTYAEFYRNI